MKQPDLTLIDGGRPDVAPGEFVFDYELPGHRMTDRSVGYRGDLDEISTVVFEECAPARPFRVHKGQSHYPGWWWAATTRRHVGYESWNERDNLCLLDFDPTVVGISSQPFLVFGHDDQGEWSHWPDYFCRLASGGARVVDVTTDRKFRKPEVALQRARTRALCDRLGWEYENVVEPDPVLLANLKWLSAYRRPIRDDHKFADALLDACDKPTPVHELADSVGPRLLVLPALFSLCWHLRLVIDLTTPLRSWTPVSPATPVLAPGAAR